VKPVSYHLEVEPEITAAYDWYEAQRPGLGERLLRAIDAGLDRVRENPLAWPIATTVGASAIRRAPLARFPFYLLYIDLGAGLQVLAFAHVRRQPGYWQHRVP
jgi:toxin ParE1/3/4